MNNFFKKQNIIFSALALLLLVVLGYLSSRSVAFLLPALLIGLWIFYLIWQRPYWGIIFVAFLLPFERLGAYETDWGTLRLSQVFIAITVMAWLGRMIIDKKITSRQFPIFIPLTLFLVVNLVGLLNSINLSRSLFVLG
ncbi:hypothetical protein KKI23_00695, partial [Patescibacteria group bacterium]|nr:hypothetical protein [Patescibacteria group bacterium]